MNQHQIEEVALERIGERYAHLRIIKPQAELAMEQSLAKYGQLAPLICMKNGGTYELVDGFKRLRAGRKLNWPTMQVSSVEIGARACKAAMIQLNRVSRSISDLEEALVLRSLYREDGLTQVEIATLLNRHKSWVSRRIGLVERLMEEVLQELGLGLLSVSIGRELAKLPQGMQVETLRTVRKYRLKKRDLERLVPHLLRQLGQGYATILTAPWEILQWEEALPSGFKGKVIAFRQSSEAVMRRVGSVSPDEVIALESFIRDALESARIAVQSLEKALQVF